jgi:hypothetical protein
MYLKDTVRKVANYIYIKQGRNSVRYCERGNEPARVSPLDEQQLFSRQGITFSCHCIYIQRKAKVVPVHETKTYRESRGITPPILNLGTIRG